MRFKLSIVAIITLLLTSALSSSNSSSFQTLTIDRKISTEGFVTISWNKSNSSAPIQLHLAADSSFTQLLQKINLVNQSSVHLSGLKNGKYFVRLFDDADQMSNVVSFQVEHRQLADALKFFALGAVLFFALVTVLIRLSARLQ